MRALSEWIAKNGADLIGHSLTLIVFLGGFAVVRRQGKADVAKDRAIRYWDLVTTSVIRNTRLMATVRYRLYMLAIQPFDRTVPLNPDIERRAVQVARLQAEMVAATLTVPPGLRSCHNRALSSFDGLQRATISGDSKLIESANKDAGNALDDWQRAAREWMETAGDELQIWQSPRARVGKSYRGSPHA